RGMAWLTGREDRDEWNYVFQKLLDTVKAAARRRDLVCLGWHWVETHRDHPGARYVRRKLMRIFGT
ncbi:MAG TPA: hypothetical protein PK019_22620, partial [Sedimentisphaerales bacterium]|nr:hypothetical protein [Sedimentisphaerales bacterium]